MTVSAKICGINAPAAMNAAVAGGAAYVGLVFYPPSPRYVTPAEAAALAALGGAALRVGLFVDADDDLLATVLDAVALDLLQLHGGETPERVAEVRARHDIAVMKTISVAGEADIARAHDYEHTADRLLFDAKPPADMAHALPGGNALSFDWRLLGGRAWACPWMLSGGLDADNVAEAVRISGAPAVDVSSGVEDAPGHKSPERIARFLEAVGRI